jgi:steroid 5-alpha reductase family enzyme
MGHALYRIAAIDLGIQWACWIVAAKLQTEKFYDFAGAVTHAALVLYSLLESDSNAALSFTTRQKVLTGMVLTWCTRLGSFLLNRILRDGRDKRFDRVRDRPARFFIFWTFQAVWVYAIASPVYITNTTENDAPLSARDYCGWAMWIAGFAIQVIADAQKRAHRAARPGQFIRSGLWRYSQHPNYFGEMLMWSGIFLSSSSVLRGAEWLSVSSPLVTYYLLTRVSGIPMLRRIARKRWGEDPAWRKYLAETSLLVPWWPAKAAP